MGRRRKTYYELARSQVDTPAEVVKKFWEIFAAYRTKVTSVVDLGAGDGRFAVGGRYQSYLGIEIDTAQVPTAGLPANAKLIHDCAFRNTDVGFSACVGNPPYVRHHDLEPDWRDGIADRLSGHTGVGLNRKCNLYVYFIFLGLLKTSSQGIVATVIPYEWLSRPSSRPLREYISNQNWQVDAYRFENPIFDGVETTASICVIDKRNRSGQWRYYSIDEEGVIWETAQVTGSCEELIEYKDRGEIWAMRGMSPGTQQVFTLSEGERIHAGLRKSDVYPCVTSLRHLPKSITTLTSAVFEKRYVDAGEKCWLIKSNENRLSDRLLRYLAHVPHEQRDTATCNARELWYKFRLSPLAGLLVSSGFVGQSAKSVVNSVRAYNVGAVHGVHDVPKAGARRLQQFLAENVDADRIVTHSGRLRKLEVKQLNTVLIDFAKEI